jgi:hypothetical protein
VDARREWWLNDAASKGNERRKGDSGRETKVMLDIYLSADMGIVD